MKVEKITNQQLFWDGRPDYISHVLRAKKDAPENFKKITDTYLAEIEKIRPKNILVVGCAFGFDVKKIKQKFPDTKITAIVISKTQLKNAKQYLNGLDITLIRANAKDIPLTDKFDLIFTTGLLMHIPPEIFHEVLSEMKRLARGHIICVEPYKKHQNFIQRVYSGTAPHYFLHDYENEFNCVGFDIIECHDILGIEPQQLSIFVMRGVNPTTCG